MSKRALLCGMLALFLSVAVYGREGFGFTKKSVDMTKTVPPAINVSGTRVSVAVDTEHTRVSGKAESLRLSTQVAVLAGDKHLQAEPKGDVNVMVALDRLDADQRSQSKVEDNYEKTKDKNGKTQYVNHPKTKNYTSVHGEIGGTYKITDSRGRLLDSGDIDRKYDRDYEYGGQPSNDKLQDQLLQWAADKIAARIVPTQVKVKVLVPKGSFEQFIPLAESGAWDRYLQSVESVRPLGDRASDAFREYALGVANEALGYSASDAKTGLDLIRKAAEHYRAAAADNPDEKIFSQAYVGFLSAAGAPIERAEASAKAYEAWASGPTTPMASTVAAVSSSKSSSPAKSIHNQHVIDMTKAGLTDENIILAIDGADKTEFDTTPEGLISLSKAGVSKSVIAHIQKRGR
jgi:hypothetical protein